MMLVSPERKYLRSDFARRTLNVSIDIGKYLKAGEIGFYLLQTNHTCCATKWMGEQTSAVL